MYLCTGIRSVSDTGVTLQQRRFTQSGRCNTANDLQVFSTLHTGTLGLWSAVHQSGRGWHWVTWNRFLSGSFVVLRSGVSEPGSRGGERCINPDNSLCVSSITSISLPAGSGPDGLTSQQLVRLQMAEASPHPLPPPSWGRLMGGDICVAAEGQEGQSWTLTHCLVMLVTLSVAARSVCCWLAWPPFPAAALWFRETKMWSPAAERALPSQRVGLLVVKCFP